MLRTRSIERLRITAIAAAAIVLGGAFAARAAAQDSADPAPFESPAPQEQTVSQTQNVDPLAIFAAPLLREGSYLMEARSALRLNREARRWELIIDSSDPTAPGVVMAVLPCTRLAEMQRMIEASPRQRLSFIVTGTVYVYRDQNYILPTHAAVIVEEESAPPSSSSAKREGAQPATESAAPPSTAPSAADEDSAEAIARQLRQRAGTMTRSASVAGDEDLDSDRLERSRNSLRPRDRAASDSQGRSDAEKILTEGTTLTQRRGRITRDAGGGWMFIFDADAAGLADPPMSLLPCMLLERMEGYARRLGGAAPALVSGHVYVHDGRNYLLPVLYRVPQERRNLTP